MRRNQIPILAMALIAVSMILTQFSLYQQLSANYLFQSPSQEIITQSFSLTSSNSEQNAYLGRDVALELEGLAVGMPGYNRHGSLELFVRNSRLDFWISEYFEVPGNDLDHPDDVGYAVAADGNTFVVGAPNTHTDTDSRGHQGNVYVYKEVINNLVPTLELVAELQEPAASQLPFDLFGYSVAIDGPFIVVGSPQSDAALNGEKDSGAVYIFDQRQENWESTPYRLELEIPQVRQLFGYAVDLNGNQLIVGAPTPKDEFLRSGNAYIFEFDPNLATDPWVLKASLTSETVGSVGRFGSAVTIDTASQLAAVGAVDENDRQGAVYLYQKTAQGWQEQAATILSHPSPNSSDPAQFGYALDLENNKLVVGSPGLSENPSGTGQVFVYGTSIPAQAALAFELRLVQGVDMIGTRFGEAVSIFGEQVAVGAPKSNSGRGAVYLFADISLPGQPTPTPVDTSTPVPTITTTPSQTPTGTLPPTQPPTQTPTTTSTPTFTPTPTSPPQPTPLPTQTITPPTFVAFIYLPFYSREITLIAPPTPPLPTATPPPVTCLQAEAEVEDGSNNTVAMAEEPLCLETIVSAKLSASDSIDLFKLPLATESQIFATLTILDQNGLPLVVGNDPETAYSISLFKLSPNEIKDHNGDSNNPKRLCNDEIYSAGEYLIFIQYNESASHGDGAARDYELELTAQQPAECQS